MQVEPNASFNYCVTAHRPTAVLKSLVANFTGPSDLNLIVAKSTRIEVHTSTATGLEAVLDVPLYGRVSSINLLRPNGSEKDSLFVLLERYKFCILEYDPLTKELVTRAQGDVRDAAGRPGEHGQLAAVDPDKRLIALQLYDGVLKIIPLDPVGRVSEAFNVRLEELGVVDIALLAGCARPTVAVLHESLAPERRLYMRTYEISLKDKDVVEVPGPAGRPTQVDQGASFLIPIPAPLGGVIVVGCEVIMYVPPAGGAPRSVAIRPAIIKAWGAIDGDCTRMLLSDQQGLLYLLALTHDSSKQVSALRVEIVGRTSSASTLSYLDNGVVYVGSRQGDSQLIRLHPQPPNPADPGNYVEVLETFPNLGPIVDFCVVDLDRQGQGQVVTCSGALTDGSLRVIRNGIGINEQATIELPGIKGVWSLRQTSMDAYDKYLVLTFVGETRLLAINQDDELDEAEIPGFESSALTLWCGNTAHDTLVQVTGAGVRVVDCHTQQLVSEWKAPAGSPILMAAGSPTQVLLATGGGKVVLLEASPEGGALKEAGHLDVGAEVACLDISPIGDDSSRSSLVAVGTWAKELLVARVEPGGSTGGGPVPLAVLTREALMGEVIPRSVLMTSLEGIPYLMVGMGDGQLHHWRLDAATGGVSERKKLALGTKPIQLRHFRARSNSSSQGSEGGAGGPPAHPTASAAAAAGASGGSVFAASDRPTVIYSSNKKLVFSNLNEGEVNYMASFNSAAFPDSLAIAKEAALTIGGVDEIQKLHIRSVPLHEQARRIAHQEETRTFGLITIANMGLDDERCSVRVVDDSTFDTLASLALEPYELGCSLASATLGEDKAPYFVAGTGVARPEDQDPSKGRILVLTYAEGKLTIVAEREVRGAVYEVVPFQAGKLLVSINNRVCVFKWGVNDDGGRELHQECSQAGFIMAPFLAARGDHILVGDLMRSVSLLLYKPEEGTLEPRAQEYNSNWTTAVAMLDDDTYLAAENSFNIYISRKNPDASTDEERQRLEVVGEYHVGEFINRFRPGSLVMRLPDSELSDLPTLLFGTCDGALGMLVSLPPPLFEMLLRLQDAMRKVVHGVGGLDHAEWRSWYNERKVSESRGVIDGDLIEALLDLAPGDVQKVVSAMGGDMSQEEVVRKVEELARLH